MEADEIPLTHAVYDVGENLGVKNPMLGVSDASVLVWIGGYYQRRTLYEDDTRGYPELDCGDLVYLGDGASAQIVATNLTYNGAFREKFTFRK